MKKFKRTQKVSKTAIGYPALTLWLCMLPPIGATATIDWNYNGSTDWGSGANWSSGAIPGSSDSVRISQSGSMGPGISGASFNIAGLSIGNLAGTSSNDGSLIIHNGGDLTTTQVTYIGDSPGLSGSITVSGSNSVWNANNAVFLGANGNGTLIIEDGATVNLFSTAPLGSNIYMGNNNPGGTDRLTVTGARSSLNLNQWLLLAYGGNSSFHNTTSIVEVSNGATINADGIDIGYGGHGILTVSSGGTITTQHGLISPYLGSKGEVTITGQSSRWSIAEELIIAGTAGNGSLTVSDGGLVEDKNGYIGNGSDSVGNVTVTGTDSRWTHSNDLFVGLSGDGSLTVSDGGLVEGTNGYIGYNATSTANVTVTGADSRWTNPSYLYVGVLGNGALTISDGGYVSSLTLATIGTYSGSSGSATVTGSGSVWENTGGLYIGYQGSAVLTIAEGAVVSAPAGVAVAADSGSTGTLNIGSALGQQASAPGTLSASEVAFGLGSGNIVFNHTAGNDEHYIFSPEVSGNGSIDVISGITTLTASNSYIGLTTVDGGILKAGKENTFSPDSEYLVNARGVIDLAGFNQQISALNHSGTIYFNGMPGAALTVANNYIGNSGLLVLNTRLDDDASSTDRLIVSGDTAGQTNLIINNVGGQGAQTVNGIEVISVSGQSDGNFTLQNRAVAGAYEYLLYKNGIDMQDGNWYLRSTYSDTPDSGGDTPIIRPEGGSYLANMAEASSIFNLRLADREGRAENSSMWLRQVGSHTRFRDNSGQLKTQSNRYIIQGGGEIFDTQFTQDDRLGAGIMFGYGHTSSQTGSVLSGNSSKGDVNGYSAGLYATWYQDAKNLNGVYVDSWLQYSWFDASVNGDLLPTENYNIDGFSASVESGYRYPVYQSQNGRVFITPQAQIIWSGQSADNHTEYNGTTTKADAKDNIQTRLGIKLSRDGVSDADKESNKLFTVYTEANWIYNSQQVSAQLDGIRINQDGTRNIGELKLGAEGKLNSNLNLWANVAQQIGDAGYSNTAVVLGVKYAF